MLRYGVQHLVVLTSACAALISSPNAYWLHLASSQSLLNSFNMTELRQFLLPYASVAESFT